MRLIDKIVELYLRIFSRKSVIKSKSKVEFATETPRIKRVNQILEVTSLSELKKYIEEGDRFCSDQYSLMKKTFRWFDPTLYIQNLGISDQAIPVSLTPDCIGEKIDYTLLTNVTNDKDEKLKGQFASLHIHQITDDSYLRIFPYNPYPMLVNILFFSEKNKLATGSKFLAFYSPNKKYHRRWRIAYRGIPTNRIYFPEETFGRAGFYGSEPDYDISNKIQIALGYQFLQMTNWHVDIGKPSWPKMRIPVDCKRLASLFKLREIKDGSDRRKALIHWVSRHDRIIKSEGSDKIIPVVKHLRGEMDFTWGGLECQIYPDIKGMDDLSKPLSVKSKSTIEVIEKEKRSFL